MSYPTYPDYEGEIRRLRTAIRNVLDGDVPVLVKKRYREDGQPSKHDICTHGLRLWEECGRCRDNYLQEVLDATTLHVTPCTDRTKPVQQDQDLGPLFTHRPDIIQK